VASTPGTDAAVTPSIRSLLTSPAVLRKRSAHEVSRLAYDTIAEGGSSDSDDRSSSGGAEQ